MSESYCDTKCIIFCGFTQKILSNFVLTHISRTKDKKLQAHFNAKRQISLDNLFVPNIKNANQRAPILHPNRNLLITHSNQNLMIKQLLNHVCNIITYNHESSLMFHYLLAKRLQQTISAILLIVQLKNDFFSDKKYF